MPSLVIDARMIDASGIGVYLSNIIPFLTSEFEVTLLGCPQKINAFPWAMEVSKVLMKAPIYSIKEQWALHKAIPACDLFWSPHYNIPLLPIKARKRIVTIHDTYHLAYRNTLTLPQKAFATIFLRAAVAKSDQVLTVSEFSKKEILAYAGQPKKDIKVIYNGVDRTLFHSIAKSAAQTELIKVFPTLPQDFILYVGNVKPHKNLKTLLKAYSALTTALQNTYKLVIVGKKEGFITAESGLDPYFKEDPILEANTHFTGYVPDAVLPLLYNSASLFVFPSLYEGFGLPPLEAMACGCPVIASEAASIPEICGRAALYFNPSDHVALQQQIEKVLGNKDTRQIMIDAGLKHSAGFIWAGSGEVHAEILKKALYL